jgi:hypothetical protein
LSGSLGANAALPDASPPPELWAASSTAKAAEILIAKFRCPLRGSRHPDSDQWRLFSNRTRYRSDVPFARQRDNDDCRALRRLLSRMSRECRLGFRPRDLPHSPTSCGLGSRFQSHQTRSFQPLGCSGSGCLAFRLDAWLSPRLPGQHCPIGLSNNGAQASAAFAMPAASFSLE